jgi:hypothetical protein
MTWQHHLVQRILRVSSAIHIHKERLTKRGGIGLGEGIIILFLEIWLHLLSLPAYFFVERDAIVSTFAEHPDDVVRYRARTGMISSALTERSKTK